MSVNFQTLDTLKAKLDSYRPLLPLMNTGFPAAVLPAQRHLKYYEALDQSHCHDDYASLIKFITSAIAESFEPYWWALGVKA